jgi:protein-disulfide isomerase-like protein with CxxC motif
VSWCWGFAPVIAGVAERHADAARVTLAPGSLGRGDRPMRP